MDPLRKIKEHKFYGVKFKFVYADPHKVMSQTEIDRIKRKNDLLPEDDILAATDNRDEKQPQMIVSDKIEEEDEKELLKVLIDESLHAVDESTDNAVVDERATDIAHFLWRCGYRRVLPRKYEKKPKELPRASDSNQTSESE